MNDVKVDFLLACPACKNSLADTTESHLHCHKCRVDYPAIQQSIPVLVHKPYEHLTGERLLLAQDAERHAATAEHYLKTAQSDSIRKATLTQLGDGLQQNSHFLNQLRDLLPPADLPITEHGVSLGADLFAALRKDWSGLPETEAEVRTANDAILSLLEQTKPQSTLVLGAGLGRTLCEIDERFGNAVGIDLSATMATAYFLVNQADDVRACQLHQGNFLRAADECEVINVNRTLAGGEPRYIVGDAAALPFLADSFDVVVSHYFTDMVPLSLWLPEVQRVLKPNGHLIHFGPLGYVFPAIQEHYAVDQLAPAFRQHHFELSPIETITNTFYDSRNRLNRFQLENLLFTATPCSD